MVSDYLHRNGVIEERARRERRSLTAMERNIILAGRDQAMQKITPRQMMNAWEMDGERDFDQVLKPISVRAVFSYYEEAFEEIPASPQYFVRESNHPELCVGSHVGACQLVSAGQKVPKTPTYDQWSRGGRKVVRK